MSNVIPFKFNSSEVRVIEQNHSAINSLGVSVLIGGKCYMATMQVSDDDSVSLRQFSTETDEAVKTKSFIINEEIHNQIDKWITKTEYGCLDTPGNIYLVSDGVFTKIGATTYNIKKRLNELQVGNASKLLILGSYPANRKLSVERYLHNIFSEKRIRGEWFDLSQSEIHKILATKPCPSKLTPHTVVSLSDINNITDAISYLSGEISLVLRKKRLRKLNSISEALYGVHGSYWKMNPSERKFFNKAA